MMDWTWELEEEYFEDRDRVIRGEVGDGSDGEDQVWLAARERDAQTIAELRSTIAAARILAARVQELCGNDLIRHPHSRDLHEAYWGFASCDKKQSESDLISQCEKAIADRFSGIPNNIGYRGPNVSPTEGA